MSVLYYPLLKLIVALKKLWQLYNLSSMFFFKASKLGCCHLRKWILRYQRIDNKICSNSYCFQIITECSYGILILQIRRIFSFFLSNILFHSFMYIRISSKTSSADHALKYLFLKDCIQVCSMCHRSQIIEFLVVCWLFSLRITKNVYSDFNYRTYK